MSNIVNIPTKLHERQTANEIRMRILDLEQMRDKMAADIDAQIAKLRRMLPADRQAQRSAAIRSWVRRNGGWRGFMDQGRIA